VQVELVDKDNLIWGSLWVTEDEKQEAVGQYMSYTPGWT
jgi:hypothetical protein